MALPLPRVVADVGPGGPFVTAARGWNALRGDQLANKFKPLEMGIKAQNALSYNNRMGNIGLFLKGISEMPVGERQIYLSDPTNRKNYMDMIETFRSGINNPNLNANFLSPEYIRSFGIGQPGQGQQGQRQQGQGQGGVSNFIGNLLGDSVAGNMLGGISSTIGNIFNPRSQNINQPSQDASIAQPNVPSQNIGGAQYGANIPPTGDITNIPQGNISPTQTSPISDQIAPEPVQNVDLNPKQRDTYSAQKRANDVGLGRTLINRADNSIALESYLHQERPELSKAFSDAFKYNQLYGKAQNWVDKFKKEQPEKYENYVFAKNTARELIGNGIRFLENMGQSHEAQNVANSMVAMLDKWDVSPQTAANIFNKTIRSLYGVSNGVLNSAESIYPGARRKLAGVPEFKGDYISSEQMKENKKEISSATSSTAAVSKIPSDWVVMRKPGGKLTAVHPEDIAEAEKLGYSKNPSKNVKGY